MAHGIGLKVLPLLLATFSSWPRVKGACYYPNGRVASNDVPCRDNTPGAACCGQGYVCLSNGICQATGEELQRPGASRFVRGSCTDKQWRSSGCPRFCIEEGVDSLDGANSIFRCPNTSEDLYYCINGRSPTDASCEQKKKVLFFPGTPSAITTIGVAPNTAASSPSPVQSSSTSGLHTGSFQTGLPRNGGNSQTGQSDSSSNVGAIAGGVIGGVALIVIAGVVGWLLAQKRIRTGHDNSADVVTPGHRPPGELKSPFEDPQRYTDTHDAQGAWKPEVRQGPDELEPVSSRREFPAGSVDDGNTVGAYNPDPYPR